MGVSLWVAVPVACGGLDPATLGAPPDSPSPSAATAGYSYDGDAGARNPAASGRPPTASGGDTGAARGGANAAGGSSTAGRSESPGSHAGGSAGGGGKTPGGGGGATFTSSGGGGALSGEGGNGSGAASGADSAESTGGSAAQAPMLGHALQLSEYVEGSSSFKALELAAREASTLDDCRIATYFNGSSSPSGSVALAGSLLAGEAYVLCSSSLGAELGATCDRSANLSFNGDDAVVLECDGNVVDVIGQVGVDPGTAWGTSSLSTTNHTLRRLCSAPGADNEPFDPFDPSVAWAALPEDTFTGLGEASCFEADDAAGGAAGAENSPAQAD